jgi:hypothetical protein
MWRVYLIEFITVLMISVMWVNIIDKHNKEK